MRGDFQARFCEKGRVKLPPTYSTLEWRIMEEKLSTIYLVNGQTALQYLMNVSKKIQANSDRSDIRVFETGISPQRHGNIRQSSRVAEEEECNRLISIAKENNLYIDKEDWDKFGNRRMIPTGESIVFLSKDGSVFTKMKSPFSKAPLKQTHPEDIIYEHLIHNMLFPSTRYRFIGISEDIKGIKIVLQQKNISSMFRVPTPK